MEQQVLAWVSQYGYIAIFLLLVFGIIGLPIPDETMLTFSGYLVYKGHLSLPLTLATAFVGSVCGISLSYFLGRRFGVMLIRRYGKYVRIKEHHLEKTNALFDRVGPICLTFGYYVPGVRHFTAYVAGMADLAPVRFCLFAYSGAAIWVSSFIGLGWFLGERWEAVQRDIHQVFLIGTIICAVVVATYFLWRWWSRRPRM